MARPTPYKICANYEEADAFLKDQASRLRRMGLTNRYGVYMKPTLKGDYSGPWGIFMIDRSAS